MTLWEEEAAMSRLFGCHINNVQPKFVAACQPRLPRGLSSGGPSGILELDCSVQLHIKIFNDHASTCSCKTHVSSAGVNVRSRAGILLTR